MRTLPAVGCSGLPTASRAAQIVNKCCFDRSKRRWGRAKHRGSYGNAGDERMETVELQLPRA